MVPGESSSEHTNSQVDRNVCIFDHFRELLEGDLAISIKIGLHDCFVDDLHCIRGWASFRKKTNLLQLLILQVISNHHLQNYKQLSIADITVAINVVDLERKVKLLLLVALGTECAKSGHKLLEIDITAAVFIKYGYHPCGKGVRVDLWQGEKLLFIYCTISILKDELEEGGCGIEGPHLVEFHEPLP